LVAALELDVRYAAGTTVPFGIGLHHRFGEAQEA
jgi:hypothetical protein